MPFYILVEVAVYGGTLQTKESAEEFLLYTLKWIKHAFVHTKHT